MQIWPWTPSLFGINQVDSKKIFAQGAQNFFHIKVRQKGQAKRSGKVRHFQTENFVATMYYCIVPLSNSAILGLLLLHRSTFEFGHFGPTTTSFHFRIRPFWAYYCIVPLSNSAILGLLLHRSTFEFGHFGPTKTSDILVIWCIDKKCL